MNQPPPDSPLADSPIYRGRGPQFFEREIAPVVRWRLHGTERVATHQAIDAAWRQWERAQKEPA